MDIYIKLNDSKIVESEEVERNIVFDYDKDNSIVGIELNLPENTLNEEETDRMKTEIINAHSTVGTGLANHLLDVAHKWKEKAVGRHMTRHGVLADIFLKDGSTIQVPWEEADKFIDTNPEKIGYRQIEVGRPRATKKED